MSDTVTAVKADPSTGTAAALDPITVSVIGSALSTIVEEMSRAPRTQVEPATDTEDGEAA